jgi:hypothetical protein
VRGDTLAAAELDQLLGHRALHGRWPGGFTSDEVLDDLMALGLIAIEVREHDPERRFACRLELRGERAGEVRGAGRSLTAATLRCLIEAEADLAAEVERGLGELRDLLGDR